MPSPWWVSDNGSHKSTLYADDTVLQTFTISSTVVSIPCPGMPATACGTPTGVVWNPIDHNGKSGYANTLYFTAGPNDEADGLFGALRPDGLYGTPPYPFPGP